MDVSVVITPGGQLHVERAADGTAEKDAAALAPLEVAFAQSRAEGLLLLASQELPHALPPALVFWRGLARQFFQAVCHLGEGDFDQWNSIEPPPEDHLALLIAEAPPMRGLEYLDAQMLRAVWHDLRSLVAAKAAAFPPGPAAWLAAANPLWHLVGRVTFHLAENKGNAERPFAFLATYTHGLSRQARPRHLPLGEALKTYAQANDRGKLESLLEPVRRAGRTSSLVRELVDTKALFAPQAWTVRQAHRFLTESPLMEEAGIVVRVPDWWSARRPRRPQVQVHLGSRPVRDVSSGMLDFQVDVALDGESITQQEFDALLAGTEGLFLLRGKWVEVDRQKLRQALDHWNRLKKEHPDGVDFVHGMRLLAGAQLDAEDPDDEQAYSWSRVTAGGWLRQTLEQIRQPASIDGFQPGRDLCARLRPYQADGVRWLWFMTGLGLGACLADDMGLGKTIQVIDLLLARKRTPAPAIQGAKADGPSLLVVPASLLGNWRQELARFAPSLRVFFARRGECDPGQLDHVAKNAPQALAGLDLVITTYGLVRRQQWLGQVRWSLVVLDEAQAIKNAGSAQTRSVKKLPAAGRIVLTGTPVENHLGDLWSLFDFCCPGLLGTAGQFKQFVNRLSKQQDARAFGALRRLVRPYILRRLKSDPAIAPDLPEKTEMRTECGLSKKQAALYQRAVEDLARRLEQAEGIGRRGVVLAVLMQLKQICNHPALYLHAPQFPPDESAKFQRLRLLCEPIADRQEKVLVFTQFQTITQPLAGFLATVFGRAGLVLDGRTPVGKRSDLVRTFQEEEGPPFFVISLKTGGSGLNLTAASHVIHFDRWWNPAVENQATDRAFRIGQKRNVLVHKFVCRGTVEERIDAMIHDKQTVADQLLDQQSETLLTEMDNEALLRFVALDIGRAAADD